MWLSRVLVHIVNFTGCSSSLKSRQSQQKKSCLLSQKFNGIDTVHLFLYVLSVYGVFSHILFQDVQLCFINALSSTNTAKVIHQ